MQIANVVVEVDHAEIKKQVTEKVDAALREILFTWDVNEMSKRTCMSKKFLETEFLHDPRMRHLERRKANGKRFWFYQSSLKVMQTIMDEWE